MKQLPRNTILTGDALEQLKTLPSDSVDTVVTSPPYFAQRKYAQADGQIGLENNVTEWVESLRAVMREVRRVLKPEGSVWLNLGDKYSQHKNMGAPPKSLLAAPERLLISLMADGPWLCRSKLIWSKTNPMPEGVTDRPSSTYDVIYMLTKSPRYFSAFDLTRRPKHTGPSNIHPTSTKPPQWIQDMTRPEARLPKRLGDENWDEVGANIGDVWRMPSASYKGSHTATYPAVLVERPILASCPEKVCSNCDRPWKREVTVRRSYKKPGTLKPHRDEFVRRYSARYETTRRIGNLKPQCACNAATKPGVVLDMFFGTGTTGVVARTLGRDFVGIELSKTYVQLAQQRLNEAGF